MPNTLQKLVLAQKLDHQPCYRSGGVKKIRPLKQFATISEDNAPPKKFVTDK